ncbi:MAG: hypothetical protein QY314_00540 [Candidatus Dojkabacteria bacterium]|nr:MAG: hypothetical protein QY314_00540 [Candidatus Dojkabacteria bacterium]
METFDTLLPPLFTTKGPAKSYDELTSSDWIATANLWIVRKSTQSILYQQRSMSKSWAPGKLDVIVGGKVNAGELLCRL